MTAEEVLLQKDRPIISVNPDSTVAEAIEKMLQNNIGAILIKDGEEYVGIWTERDLMSNVVTEGFYSKTSKIKDYMNTNLDLEPHTDTLFQLMDKCLRKKHRHLIIQKNGKIIGMLSSGDIGRAQLMEKSKEFDDLNNMIKWDYYEDWKWKKKNR